MNYFFSYGDDGYRESKKRIFREAQESGFFDVVRVHGPEDLPSDLKKEFQEILKSPKGGGYWLWKILLLDRYLRELQDHDFLIYADAGCTINRHGGKRFREYLEMLERSQYGFISFSMDCRENQWTIKELYRYFHLSIDDPSINKDQYIGGVLIIKKSPHAVTVIDEVMRLLHHDPYLITDRYNKQQDDFFYEARHDQSILSLARKKYGSVVLDDETNIIPFSFLRRMLIAYIGRRISRNTSPEEEHKPIPKKKATLKSFVKYILLLLSRIFKRKYPLWATRIRN